MISIGASAIGPNPAVVLPIGQNIVTLVVNDGALDSLPDEVLVEVVLLSPRDLKIKAIDGLTPFESESSRTRKAISEINKSLAKGWLDDSHLEPKNGKKVFDSERKAVKELMKVVKDEARGRDRVSDPALITIIDAIDALVAADRLLAQIALDDLAGIIAADPDRQGKVDRELAKGLEDLNKGDEQLADGKPDKAIDSYRKAWEHAVNAAKEAAKAPDGDDDFDDDSSDDDDD